MRDLDFIVATKAPEVVSEFFLKHPLVESILVQGATKSSVRLHSGIQCNINMVFDKMKSLRSITSPAAKNTTLWCGIARCKTAGP